MKSVLHDRTSTMALQPPRLRTTLHLSIELGASTSQKNEKMMPSVRCTTSDAGGSHIIGDIRADVAVPGIEADDKAFAAIDVSGVLSIVLDEEAWLAEVYRVLSPGGYITMTVPAEGPLAWLDAQNIYRYVKDITGRGRSLGATLPTGWTRHYRVDDVRQMVEQAGFTIRALERTGIGLAEFPHLAGLVISEFLLKIPTTEQRLRPTRERLERLDQEIQLPGVGKLLYVMAARPL